MCHREVCLRPPPGAPGESLGERGLSDSPAVSAAGCARGRYGARKWCRTTSRPRLGMRTLYTTSPSRDRTDIHIAGIRVKDEWPVCVRVHQHRSRDEGGLKDVKSLGSGVVPDVRW
ncbi:hypothetical protein AAFF_G00358070 [Aldrovandia affinis]|uniref:Uncharacterized protein n=1 Tax=Aldrovandia affinis TaxID=143900 RepID=A0AAD7X209_9TELE|nr:hypothetical protein AAFF_G00358070 [Aldrovandia affinis]